MRADETPFYFTRVECPICRTVNEFETIKMGAYTESGRDTDFRPLKREWRNPRYNNTNPLLYFMATCSSCFYTREFNRKFREWKSDSAFRTHRQTVIRQQHLTLLADEMSPAKLLGTAIWPASYPLRTAINKLLLGILDEEQLEGGSHFDIARWYLRIAWLFREMSGGEETHASPWTILRRQITHKLESIRRDAESAGGQVAEVKALLDCHPESVVAAPSDNDGPPQCGQSVQTLAGYAEALIAETDNLLQLLSQEQSATEANGSTDDAERYGDYPSYTSFLREIKTHWSGIPLDEMEALGKSLEHYRKAYREGRDIPQGNAQIQLAYMIGELSRRTGRDADARQFYELAMRTGREWIHKLKNDPTTTALARHIVDLAIDQVHAMREAGQVS